MKPHIKNILGYYPKRMQRTAFIRTQTHKKKRLRWKIFLVILISAMCLIILAANFSYLDHHYFNVAQPAAKVKRSKHAKKKFHSQKAITVSKSTNEFTTAKQSTKAVDEVQPENNRSATNPEIARNYLIGQGFAIEPISYDGIAADKAMDENIAPQNLVHDGSFLIYFLDPNKAIYKGLGSYNPVYNLNYDVDDNTILIKDLSDQIPYSVNNGVITVHDWNTQDNAGHVITWRLDPSTEAKTILLTSDGP